MARAVTNPVVAERIGEFLLKLLIGDVAGHFRVIADTLDVVEFHDLLGGIQLVD
jgi:hypothetical protein